MLNYFNARGWMVMLMLLGGFVLTGFIPSSSHAKKRHSIRSVRKTSHSALHNKRHSKFSARHHRANTHPLTEAQKAEIIGKIRSIASAEALPEESNSATQILDGLNAEDIAQAAKEEREQDNIQVSIDDFIREHNRGIADDPATAKERQSDFTLFEQSNPAVAATRSDVMQQIIDWVGTRYHFGGVGRQGIDCSAFTREVFRRSFNVELPRTASEQAELGEGVKKGQLHFGDLVFFHTARRARVSHVGIYVGEGLFANASCSQGVTVCSLESEYWSKHYLFAKRLFTNTATAEREIGEKLRLAAATVENTDTEAN